MHLSDSPGATKQNEPEYELWYRQPFLSFAEELYSFNPANKHKKPFTWKNSPVRRWHSSLLFVPRKWALSPRNRNKIQKITNSYNRWENWDNGCFWVLRKESWLFRFCVVVWVLFSVFSNLLIWWLHPWVTTRNYHNTSNKKNSSLEGARVYIFCYVF